MGSLSLLDGVWLVAVVLSMVLGLLRGIVKEVMSVLGWLVAWLGAQAWGGPLAGELPGLANSPGIRQALGYAVTFAVLFLAWRLVTWLLQQVVQASPLAPFDRVMGGVFGLIRGALAVAALVALVDYTPIERQAFWHGSTGVAWARGVVATLKPLLARSDALNDPVVARTNSPHPIPLLHRPTWSSPCAASLA